mgnify:CR=1 FL=1
MGRIAGSDLVAVHGLQERFVKMMKRALREAMQGMNGRERCALFGMMTMLLGAACTGTPAAPSAAIPTPEPAGRVSSTSWPQSEGGCEQAGGRWEQLGLIGIGCNLPTTDGGQSCGRLQDCQGLCLAADPRTMQESESGVKVPNSDYVESVNASGKDVEGICAEWLSTFGCQVIVESGRYEIICID